MRAFPPHRSLIRLVVVSACGILAGCKSEPPPPAATFVGSAACVSCHAEQASRWQQSQHAVAMQEATSATVLAQFGQSAPGSSAATRFFQRDGRFFTHTEGSGGKPADFELPYVFGVYPLQQYLVPLPGGRLQAFGMAWDSRPEKTGGQRWFSLYPNQQLKPGSPLHWTGIDQTWNYQCADCHSTDVRKNYDASTNAYDTKWSEISVGCESCHGPASNHVAWANKTPGSLALEKTRGLVQLLDERRGIAWQASGSPTAQRSAPRASSREIETCARCHARRGQFTDQIHAGDDWLDGFHPALIEPGLYYPDGQQRDEVYTWGSFVQSRMHAAGVTCSDCHEPHAGKLRAAGNAVCAQCHAPATFDTTAHHHHAPGSKGAECAACHMPTTTYMVVDPRHDHSLRIPRPDRSVSLGTPNACNDCHADRTPQWAADAIAAWYPQRKPGFQIFAEAFEAAERGTPEAAEALAALATNRTQPALVRASAVARLAPVLSPDTLAAVTTALADPDALVRTAAAETLAAADPATRAEHLAPLLHDQVRLARMTAARSLAGEPEARLLADERGRFTAALDEWIAAQRFNADRPEAQTNLGTLYAERGATDDAIAAFQRALTLDSTYVQAAVNLADTYRMSNDEPAAERVLRESLARNPGSAAVYHALGLSLIRGGRKSEAVAALKEAATLAPDDARMAYVYAIGLHDTGNVPGSLAVLRQAIARHPHDESLRSALASYENESR